jgi:hypothetical protein
MTVAPVLRVLNSLGVRYALIGAHAMAVRGYPRFSADLDLLTTDRRVLESSVWRELVAAGATIDPRHGDADDPLAGVVHIVLSDDSDIDVVVGRWAWEARLVERAEPLSLMGAVLPVPAAADLILLKLAAGGYVDKQDAAALLATGDRQALVRDVEATIGEVRPDIRPLWHELLAAVPDSRT